MRGLVMDLEVGQNNAWKFNTAPEKKAHPKRKAIFQPSFCRGELLVSGSALYNFTHLSFSGFKTVIIYCIKPSS